MTAPTPTLLPSTRDLITHSHQQIGEFPKSHFLVIFHYPDCTRTFNGEHWSVTPNLPEAV